MDSLFSARRTGDHRSVAETDTNEPWGTLFDLLEPATSGNLMPSLCIPKRGPSNS
jgi:hypothetical protein